MVYAFARIRAILNITPNLFIQALAASPIVSGPNTSPGINSLSLFGLNLAELLARHRRALAGGNFYSTATSEELSFTVQSQTNLLQVLIDVCLQALCSELPYVSSTSINSVGSQSTSFVSRYGFTEVEFRANKYVQTMAAQVLELILKVSSGDIILMLIDLVYER